jgi:histidinol-phosphate aminotransferase
MSATERDPRPGYRDLHVYRTEIPAVEFGLGDNTNLFGSAPSAIAVLREWAGDPSRYPSVSSRALREAIADWIGVSPDNVVCGCGSNDIIDSAMRALAEPGSTVAYAAPTFVMTPHFAAANSLKPVPVPIRPDGDCDAAALLSVPASLYYVATPNNPTGRAATPAELDRLIAGAPGVVILDEAYAEFGSGSRAREAVERKNLLVTRTFSKAWGLAGLRLGYGIGPASLVLELEKARGPFKVNAVAELAATAAVRNDRAWLAATIAKVQAARTSVTAELRALGYSVFDSSANFLGVKVPDAVSAARFLADRGLGVRAFPKTPVVGEVLRITLGPEEPMRRLVAAMAELPR